METNKKLRIVGGVAVAVFMILLIEHSGASDENNKVVCPQFQKEYSNIHVLSSTLEKDVMYESPKHTIAEKIVVDPRKVFYQDSKLNLGGGSVSYIIDMDNAPAETLLRPGTNLMIDSEYRGKALMFGEEYYVRDIGGLVDTLYLSKGRAVYDITSEGYASEYMEYKFKIDHLIYSTEHEVEGIQLVIQKPDGREVQRQTSKTSNAEVDNLEISAVYAEIVAGVEVGSIFIYDKSSEITLRNNKKLVLNGEEKKNWVVDFRVLTKKSENWVDEEGKIVNTGVSGYDYVLEGQRLLDEIVITYMKDETLEEGERLEFPRTYSLRLGDDGYLHIEGGINSCDELSSLRGYSTVESTVSSTIELTTSSTIEKSTSSTVKETISSTIEKSTSSTLKGTISSTIEKSEGDRPPSSAGSLIFDNLIWITIALVLIISALLLGVVLLRQNK